MIKVDARGLSCPEPVMLTNEAFCKNPNEKITVLVDEMCARLNVEKFAKSKKREPQTREEGNEWIIEF